MGIKIEIPVRVVTFRSEELDKWRNGERENCKDSYCRKLPGTKGFGEFIVGRYFESLGYEWIHHDYNLFGGNRQGKYPVAEEVFRKHFGDERYEQGRQFYRLFSPYVHVQEPDLMIYHPDFSEVRFAEVKRMDTNDRLNEAQLRGMALLKLLYECEVDIFYVVEEGKDVPERSVVWEF